MVTPTTKPSLAAMRPVAPRMTQPEELKTTAYVYGVEKLNGYDAWALFKACAADDLPKAQALVAKDRRLVNAQFWYQFPIHMAVRAGHADIVKLLLDQGADPGQSRFTYNSWDKLLLCSKERGYRQVESILQRAMAKRINYTPDFDVLKAAIIARDSRKIDSVLRRQPSLVRSSDALRRTPRGVGSDRFRQVVAVELPGVVIGLPICMKHAVLRISGFGRDRILAGNRKAYPDAPGLAGVCS